MSAQSEQELEASASHGPEEGEAGGAAGQTEGELEHVEDAGLAKAIEAYRKAAGENLTDEERAEVEKRVSEMMSREIIEVDEEHVPVEIPVEKSKVSVGPPTLTRFEKARIIGARALQLSLGAPPFIDIPSTAHTSLDIAMKELDERVLPIVIKRVLPNGDYQNIPLNSFAR